MIKKEKYVNIISDNRFWEREIGMFDIIETGKRLAKLRRSANMTQMEVAEKLGISFQAVSCWEHGKTMPDISNLLKIAQIYNVSVDEILSNERQANAVSASPPEKRLPICFKSFP